MVTSSFSLFNDLHTIRKCKLIFVSCVMHGISESANWFNDLFSILILEIVAIFEKCSWRPKNIIFLFFYSSHNHWHLNMKLDVNVMFQNRRKKSVSLTKKSSDFCEQPTFNRALALIPSLYWIKVSTCVYNKPFALSKREL